MALETTSVEVVPPATVLVAGATGGVGQLVCAKLIARGYRVKALTRSTSKAEERLGADLVSKMELCVGDIRDEAFLTSSMTNVDAVISATGTTAFPSDRWGENKENGPEQTDLIGTGRLIDATPKSIRRFIYVTSAGVERYNKFGPFMILNAFGVLKYKAASEKKLMSAGIPYTIFRPGRLTDGPYTSYDLNTLIQGKAGDRLALQLSPKDDLSGECSRIVVADAVVEALAIGTTTNKCFACESIKGQAPADAAGWKQLFDAVKFPDP